MDFHSPLSPSVSPQEHLSPVTLPAVDITVDGIPFLDVLRGLQRAMEVQSASLHQLETRVEAFSQRNEGAVTILAHRVKRLEEDFAVAQQQRSFASGAPNVFPQQKFTMANGVAMLHSRVEALERRSAMQAVDALEGRIVRGIAQRAFHRWSSVIFRQRQCNTLVFNTKKLLRQQKLRLWGLYAFRRLRLRVAAMRFFRLRQGSDHFLQQQYFLRWVHFVRRKYTATPIRQYWRVSSPAPRVSARGKAVTAVRMATLIQRGRLRQLFHQWIRWHYGQWLYRSPSAASAPTPPPPPSTSRASSRLNEEAMLSTNKDSVEKQLVLFADVLARQRLRQQRAAIWQHWVFLTTGLRTKRQEVEATKLEIERRSQKKFDAARSRASLLRDRIVCSVTSRYFTKLQRFAAQGIRRRYRRQRELPRMRLRVLLSLSQHCWRRWVWWATVVRPRTRDCMALRQGLLELRDLLHSLATQVGAGFVELEEIASSVATSTAAQRRVACGEPNRSIRATRGMPTSSVPR